MESQVLGCPQRGSRSSCKWAALEQQQKEAAEQAGRLPPSLPFFSQEDRQRDLEVPECIWGSRSGTGAPPTPVSGDQVHPWAPWEKGRVSLLLGLLAPGPEDSQQAIRVLEPWPCPHPGDGPAPSRKGRGQGHLWLEVIPQLPLSRGRPMLTPSDLLSRWLGCQVQIFQRRQSALRSPAGKGWALRQPPASNQGLT